jgi:hypothetical protein
MQYAAALNVDVKKYFSYRQPQEKKSCGCYFFAFFLQQNDSNKILILGIN